MADDSFAQRDKLDLDTDEGLEAFMRDLETRRPVPESLRYPATAEDYDRMTADAVEELDRGESHSLDEVRTRFADRIAAARRV